MNNETPRQRHLREEEEALLAGAPERILAEVQKAYPVISETVFKNELLDLLANPFTEEFVRRYERFVPELTLPLRVYDDGGETFLFEIPSFLQSPKTTVSYGQGVTAEHFFVHLRRTEDLGGRDRNQQIRQFMGTMTQRPNYMETVIRPIQAILVRYNKTMAEIPSAPAETSPSAVTTDSNDAFSEEYED